MYVIVSINVFIYLFSPVIGKDLTERYSWTELDYKFDSPDTRLRAIQTKQYIPENCIPSGIEISTDKVFVTIPRYKIGVPATLTYINLNTTEKSPLLTPYPNWSENHLQNGSLKSLHHLDIDSCHRLWSVDSSPDPDLSPDPSIVIIDLRDSSIRKHNLPKVTESSFTNIVVDVDATNCADAFAYIADSRGSALVVYSLLGNVSKRITHPYFSYDPLSTTYQINDIIYKHPLGLIGMTLSNKRPSGYKDLYFHPGSSDYVFNVSTKYVRSFDTEQDYQILGYKGPSMQSYTCYFHQASGILFYNIINRNAIGCWNSRKFPREFSDATNDIVARNDTSLIYVIDLRSDTKDNLWIMSNKLPLLTKKGFRNDQINFRIFSVDVKYLIGGSVCDETRPRNKLSFSTVTYY